MKYSKRIILINGQIFDFKEQREEPLSKNTIYIIRGEYKGPNDEKYGYIRNYYGEGTSFIYAGEIKEFIYE